MATWFIVIRVDTSFIFLPILLKHSRICNYFTNCRPLNHNFCLFPLPYICNNVIFFDFDDYDMWLFSRNLRSRKWGNRLSLKLMSNFKLANFLEYIPQEKTSLKNVKTVFPISQPHSFIDGGTNTPLWATTIFEYLTI